MPTTYQVVVTTEVVYEIELDEADGVNSAAEAERLALETPTVAACQHVSERQWCRTKTILKPPRSLGGAGR